MRSCEHLVQFYDSDNELLSSVVPYLADGLGAGEMALVVATEEHRAAFAAELVARGVDLDASIAAGSYVALDAARTLACLRPEGTLQREAFFDVVGTRVRAGLASHRGLRAYGEMVALLWDEGDLDGASELEGFWNELLAQEHFGLLCAYPASLAAIHHDAVREVCRAHTSVVPSFTTTDVPVEGTPLSAEFSPDLDSPGRVRVLLRSALSEFGLGEDAIERGLLTASELAANAVLHARTPFRLFMLPKASSFWIGVEDRSPLSDRPEIVSRYPHGLALVASLALRWGITPRGETGKLVWAELPL